MIYAVVQDSNDEVVNVIEWDGTGTIDIPAGTRLQDATEASTEDVGVGIGGTLTVDNEYTPQ